MTLRPLHYAIIILLSLLALLAALLYQRAVLMLTETDIIEAYAYQYLTDAGEGAQRTDCRAKPGGNSATRMVVICGPEPFDASRHYEYHVGPLGGLIKENGPADWPTKTPLAPRDAA